MYTMDRKVSAAGRKKRYQDSIKVLKTCADAPDKIKKAAAVLKEMAEGGYVEAQCSLGEFYSRGYYGMELDLAQAAYWYEEAAKRGSIKAAGFLANLFCSNCINGISPEQTAELALKWHKKWFSMLEAKAEKGGVKEAEALMNCYIYDPPADMEGEQATALARKWYEKWIALLKAKAEEGSVRAKKKLAEVLYSGDGIPEDLLSEFSDEEDDSALEQSVELYEQLAAQGDAEAYFSLGCAYDHFEAPEEDLKKSFDYFMKAAQLGYVQAYVCLGSAYFRGKGVEKDWVKAREMYQTGAAMGNPLAKFQLANCFKRGTGGEIDYPAARRMYLQLAEHQNGDALYELGDMYLKGLGVEVDLQKAFDYFTKAEKRGNRAAENALNSKKFRDFKK